MQRLLFIAGLSYLIGSIASAYIIGKAFRNLDIREHGSGNSGATNALRTMGFKLGFLTFLMDFTKGVSSAAIGYKIYGFNGALIASLFVVVGHNYPVFLRFKGGKGIATTIGAMAIVQFPIALIAVLLGIIIALITKYVSLGSIVFLTLNFLLTLTPIVELNSYRTITCLLLLLMGLIRHRSNISRLINKTENKLGR